MPDDPLQQEEETAFPLRAAVIDLGSNALRLLAGEFEDPRSYRVLENLRVPVRLGQSAFLTKKLDTDLIDQTVDALKQFRARMDELGIEHQRAVATSAVRESGNARELIDRVAEETAVRIEPITGVEEGRLVWVAIRSRVDLAGQRWLLADLGGGSLELSLAESEELAWTLSLPLGTVRLLEKVTSRGEIAEDADPAASLRLLLEDYADTLASPVESAGAVQGMLATGGNADALADLAGLPADRNGVRKLATERLREIIDRLAGLTVQERITQLNLRPDRADVILPAAIIYERLASLSGAEVITIPGVGLKEGLLLDLIDDLVYHPAHEAEHTREVEKGALALGRKLRFEEAHARQVTRLTLQLFDALESVHGLGEADRRILLTSAMLHDVGKVIASKRHHKHSRYLIRNAELPGLTPDEVELAAHVARYHRSTRPKRSHGGYGKLESSDRKRVTKMAALLRVGDALDQQHRQGVEKMMVTAEDERVILRLVVDSEIDLEDWSFKRKRKLFERIFERRLLVEHGGATASGM